MIWLVSLIASHVNITRKIQNGAVLVLTYPGCAGKWPPNERCCRWLCRLRGGKTDKGNRMANGNKMEKASPPHTN